MIFDNDFFNDEMSEMEQDCGAGEPDEGGCPEDMEYEEWQDLYGGDDWDHGQYDNEY